VVFETGAAGAAAAAPAVGNGALELAGLPKAVEVLGDALERGPEPQDGALKALLPVGAHGGAQVVGRRDEGEILLLVEGHGPGRPAGVHVQALLRLVRGLVAPQVDEAQALRLDKVLEDVLLADHLELVGQDAEDGRRAGAGLRR
jgi:hypothetical protein